MLACQVFYFFLQTAAALEKLSTLQQERAKLEAEVGDMKQEVVAKNCEIKSLQEQASLVRFFFFFKKCHLPVAV